MPHTLTHARPALLLGFVVLLADIAGCAANKTAPEFATATKPALPPAAATRPVNSFDGSGLATPEEIRTDPAAFVRAVAERTHRLQSYTVTLTREERRGMLGRVYGPERISCWFRRAPFSVRMKWLDPEVKYGESTYVAGANDGKLKFVSRHGLFGLEPGVTIVDIQTPVTWGETKNPVTDFGLERMMERTLDSMQKAGGTVSIKYQGLKLVPLLGRAAHHLRLEYPPKDWKAPFHDLYIDTATELPCGTVLSLADGQLDSAYFYTELDPAVRLHDADFVLEAEREGAKQSATTQPAAKQSPPAKSAG